MKYFSNIFHGTIGLNIHSEFFNQHKFIIHTIGKQMRNTKMVYSSE
ncbi:hypothetical protein M153_8990002656 [Pseudoloma neurophilia]|uniref:Uncharacterized protein n=1 Tax=Pseudoloma neurophilia TaxID=146866 RepID=A0A0R0LZT6_9MICR|nr:hypothetical protein M153_8990002656 [Pseudoloma neurophilia]